MAHLAQNKGVKSTCTEHTGTVKGGDALGMNSLKQEDRAVVLESAATDAELLDKLNQYLQSCRLSQKEDGKKATMPFPNLAGFCRWLGWGAAEMELLQKSDPELYDRICTVLEDEALNSDLSASVLTAYLKQRLWRTDISVEKSAVNQGDQLRLVFEHNILEDGS